MQSLTEDIATRLNLSADTEGALVTRVDPTGLAFQAGVRTGDLIVAINDTAITKVSDFVTVHGLRP